MIKKLKVTLLSLGLMFGVAALAPLPVGAQGVGECLDSSGGITQCTTTGAQATDPDAADVSAEERVNEIIQLVINVFSLVVGVVSVIMIIIGGLKYITSGGDSGNVSGAKNTILYAIIGLVVVALAQIIVRFVLESATAV